MNKPNEEAIKDTSRGTLFLAVSTIVTYFLGASFDLPVEVSGAIAIIMYALVTYVDSKIHHTKKGKLKDVNGLVPF
jgi:hypothetical protein